jgi:hypothetical protein
MRALIENRATICIALAASAGCVLLVQYPFPGENAILHLIEAEKPAIYGAVKAAYIGMLFTTPYFGFALVFSVAYIFVLGQDRKLTTQKLPPTRCLEHAKVSLLFSARCTTPRSARL